MSSSALSPADNPRLSFTPLTAPASPLFDEENRPDEEKGDMGDDLNLDEQDVDDGSELLASGSKEKQKSSSQARPSSGGWMSCGFLQLSFYQPYFDISTSDIGRRLLGSLMPWKGDLYESDIKGRVDLYGPLWISSTLITLMAVCGNLASYINHFQSNSQSTTWDYDLLQITTALFLVYGYVFVLPLVFWIGGMCLGCSVLFTEYVCLLGYSLTPILPVAVLCLAPVEIFRWILVLLSVSMSGLLVAKNLIPIWKREIGARWFVPLIVLGATHFSLALAFKLRFFEYAAI